MPKLNGVKTVAERITYNGAEYVKADGRAQAGDIVKVTKSCGGHSVGTVGVVVEQPDWWTGGKRTAVLANGKTRDHTNGVELVAPVEALFNRE